MVRRCEGLLPALAGLTRPGKAGAELSVGLSEVGGDTL